ncbi:MAG: hypothetical protein LBK95_17330 [Bifidobacteriaceae bacterium]|jgi:hypothetical protein|nr:hypothetical protein [Bifidobacteriaceae bacterium]
MKKVTQRLKKSALALGLTALMVVGLSACMKMDAEFTVNTDNTVSSKMIVAGQDSVLEPAAAMAGVSVRELLAQSMESSGQSLDDPDVKYEEYAADGYTGWTITSTKPQPLGDFQGETAQAGSMSLIRDGDEFKLTGTVDMTSEASAMGGSDEAASMMEGVDIKFTFIFPGKVKSSTGTIDGNKVTFTPKVGESTSIEAVASAKAGLGSLLIILGIAVGGIVVVAAVFILLLRARKNKAARNEQDAAMPGAYPGAPAPGFAAGQQPAFGAPPTQPGFAAPPAAGYGAEQQPDFGGSPQAPAFGAPAAQPQPGFAVPPAQPDSGSAPSGPGFPPPQPDFGAPPQQTNSSGTMPQPGFPPPAAPQPPGFGAPPPPAYAAPPPPNYAAQPPVQPGYPQPQAEPGYPQPAAQPGYPQPQPGGQPQFGGYPAAPGYGPPVQPGQPAEPEGPPPLSQPIARPGEAPPGQ